MAREDYRASEGTSWLRAGMRGRAKVLRQEPAGHVEEEPEDWGAGQREPGEGAGGTHGACTRDVGRAGDWGAM